jgi:hypothetical protein
LDTKTEKRERVLREKFSVADPVFIPDPGSEFFQPVSRIWVKKLSRIPAPDPGSATMNLIIFNPKNSF